MQKLNKKDLIFSKFYSINKPFNTASVKWANIDFEKQIWTIPAKETKTKIAHEIPLTKTMIKVPKEQLLSRRETSHLNFPAQTIQGHINRDSIGKAIKNLGGKNKWHKRASSHGFKTTFRTISSQHNAEIIKSND
ncbi:tyrosine-type recombinase/integrase [Campylobacter jejuni]|uniref:tyrosine-type recombinase/integrase n=1 Tax=Campylobacter jejuni TaxID=197 RepID=UPI0002D7208D|nr:tyrosine-type recombinase/integrase [Campylobacter jejuni]